MVTSEKRMKKPMKRVNGKWTTISWDQALDEISAKLLDLREKDGPDGLHFNGSAKVSNEMAYLQRKFAAFWGSNNIDHQARICHSTTVAGVANTWGYGAMTNSLNDIRHAKSMFFIGSNAPEAHPIAMQHILHAKEVNNAPIIVVDPRFTKLAAKATDFLRIRPGTDAAFIMGLVNAVITNGWQDKEFIRTRVAGYEEMVEVASHYSPEAVENVTGIPASEVTRIAGILANNRPTSLTWCMGGTQHSIGSSITRSFCILQLVLGNMGKSGGGTNIFRGHDNIQGATDMCVLSDNLPAYYGLSDGAWKHWCRVWDVDYDWMVGRFPAKEWMNKKGFTLARWYEGVLGEEKIESPTPIKAMIQWGCGSNSNSQYNRVVKALNMLELLVIVDPFPTIAAAVTKTDNVYILPGASQYESSGSVTSTSRQIQWRHQVVDPVYDSKNDYQVMELLVKKLGFGDEFYKNIKQTPEDITRELGSGSLTIGYNGQTPERLKKHMANGHTFNIDDLQAKGGLPFRNRFGVEKKYDSSGRTENQLAAEGVYNPGSEVKGGYPEFKDVVPGTNWKTDLSQKTLQDAIARGMAPFGNARARCVVWNFPDQVPIHREPLHSPRPDLLAKYPTYEDKPNHFRVHTRYLTEQKPDLVKDYPIVITTGRVVEHMGGGAETKSNKYLAELQPEMYVEINPRMANNLGIRNGDLVVIESPEGAKIKVKAKFTKRVDEKTIFLPFHFAGTLMGESYVKDYPDGHAPFTVGDPANVVTNYGYDIVTQMQATKDGLCKVSRA
ncbi:MAG: formate dehydrogenase subunit alpha [Desulfobulbaceae bacterium]|nr:formate dehydrogenase subunit alpha [Desulfobulbaceae bacterium]